MFHIWYDGGVDKVAKASVADLLINLSAGWFVLALGVPFLAELALIIKILYLTGDITAATICLYIAIRLRRRIKK